MPEGWTAPRRGAFVTRRTHISDCLWRARAGVARLAECPRSKLLSSKAIGGACKPSPEELLSDGRQSAITSSMSWGSGSFSSCRALPCMASSLARQSRSSGAITATVPGRPNAAVIDAVRFAEQRDSTRMECALSRMASKDSVAGSACQMTRARRKANCDGASAHHLPTEGGLAFQTRPTRLDRKGRSRGPRLATSGSSRRQPESEVQVPQRSLCDARREGEEVARLPPA